MKRKDAIQKLREHQNAVDVNKVKRLSKTQAKLDVENLESNLNRARSITVGTSFGGTTEIMMRSDGGRHIWCVMQPVEVIELIHQLAANVGCQALVKPREDFAKWRDWTLTEEEKKHYGNWPPFVNDISDVQRMGTDLKNIAQFIGHRSGDGAPNLMVDKEGLLNNELINKNGRMVMLGGAGGGTPEEQEYAKRINNETNTMATKKSANGRKHRRSSITA